MSDFNISMVLRLVDRMSAPARRAARPLQALGDDAEQLQAQMAAIGRSRAAAEKVQELGRKAGLADDQIENLRRETARLVDEETELARRLATTTDELVRRSRLPTDAATRAVALGGAMGTAGAGLRAQGAGMVAGAQSGAMGVAVAGFAASRFLRPAIEFERALSGINKVIDFDSADGLERLGEGIIALSTDGSIPMATSELAAIVEAAGQVGVIDSALPDDEERAQLLAFAQEAAQMGVAFDMAASNAGRAMGRWRTSMGLSRAETLDLGDAINHLTNNMGAEAPDLVDLIRRQGAVAQSAGLAATETAALGAAILAGGAGSEIASTGLKNFTNALVRGDSATDRQKEVLAELGIDGLQLAEIMQVDAQGGIISVIEALERVPAAQRSAAIGDLFGQESLGAIMPLIENVDNLRQAFSLIEDPSARAGAMLAEYNVQAGITDNSLTVLRNDLTAVAVTIGTQLLPELNDLIDRVTPAIRAFRQWAEANPELVVTIAQVAAGLLAAKAAVVILGFTFGWILGPVGRLLQGVGWIIRMLGSTGLGRVILGLVRGPFSILFGAFRVIAGFLIANPIVAAVAAIAGIGYLIYQNWDQIVAYFMDKVETIRAAFDEGLLNGVLALLAEFNPFTLMIDAWDALIEKVTGFSITDLLGSVDWGAIFGDPVAYLRGLFSEPTTRGSAADVIASGNAMMPGAASRLPGRDSGSVVQAGGLYGINERGDEFFMPGSSGRMINTATLRSAIANGGGAASAPPAAPATFHIYQQPGEDAEALARRIDALERARTGSTRALHDGGAYAD